MIRQWLGSLLFTLWMFTSVFFFAIGVLLLAPFPHEIRFKVAVAWAKVVMHSVRVLCRLDFVVEGRENISSSAAVYLLKHSSAFETIAEIMIFPRQTWVLKRELMWVPIFGWAMMLLKPIAIDRGGGRRAVNQVVRLGKERLSEGVNVMIFPEGTRVRHGESRRYGMSGAALAGGANVPIIPVAHNAGLFWPRRGVMKHPGTITFVIGEPVYVGGRDIREVNAEVQDWIEAEVAKMPGRAKPD